MGILENGQHVAWGPAAVAAVGPAPGPEGALGAVPTPDPEGALGAAPVHLPGSPAGAAAVAAGAAALVVIRGGRDGRRI